MFRLSMSLPYCRSVAASSGSRRGPAGVCPRMTQPTNWSSNLAAGGGGKGSGGGRRLCATGGGGPGDEPKASGIWSKYLELLDSHPASVDVETLITRAVTCGVLNGLGDIFSQLFVEKVDFNAQRTFTFTALGLVFVGPTLFYWYNLLGKLVPGTGLASILGALALDQFAFAPVFIASFISILTAIEDKPEAVKAKLERDLLPAVKVNWILWIPAQFINFKFVPPNLRVLAVNVTALIWNVYMSYQSHKTVDVSHKTAAH